MAYSNTFWRALGCASSHYTLAFALAGFGLATAGAVPALAQSANAPVNLDLGSVLATGTAGGSTDYQDTPGTAPYEAPSVTPLNSTQPTSLVTKHTIDNQLSGTQSWADIARLTPSVNVISPNGPGLQEGDGPTIRGFQDGQYNVTWDGIPIGDSNDFTHHTTSFFTNSVIGETIIDRGPGTAETVGDATFGGTISIRTINPAATPTLTLNGEYGSYDTTDGGLRLDTGAIQAANGSSAVFNVEHIQSNGALQNANQERSNFFGKVVIPLSSNTTLTLLSDYNKLYQNPSIGATAEQMQALGWNYAYNSDPNSQADFKYNNDHITTDIEYADLQSNFGNGWLYDGKIYTYAYYHHDLNGDDANDTGPDGITQAPTAIQNEVELTPGGPVTSGVPGQVFLNDYRSVGTIQRLEKDFDWGNIKTGVWFDHQSNTRFVQNVDLTDGNAINFDPNDSNGGLGTVGNAGAVQSPGFENDVGSIERLQHNQLYTFQPYGQVEYSPIENLTLIGGVKYAFFKRALDAQVQQKTEMPTGYEHNYDKLLPSFEAKYSFTPSLSAYAQAAEGFLAPNLNTFYTTQISAQSIKPESTLNFQTGLAYQDEHWALGGDVYDIHFQNFIDSQKETVTGFGPKQTVFFNAGGAIYRGIEGEAAYSFGNGITLFSNAGYNQAFRTASNMYITQAPQGTANLGAIYDANGIYASVVDQWTGGEFSGNAGTPNPNVLNATSTITGGPLGDVGKGGKNPNGWYDPYNVVNVALGYTFNHDVPHMNQINVKLNVDNITNQKQIIFDNGTNGVGDLLYFRLTGIAAFVTVSVPLTF
jgi:iron complex outermembrane recepter protein